MDNPPYLQWVADAELLALIGRALFPQDTRITVRLPRELAERALAAWRREDYEGELPAETHEQTFSRHRAGTLGLIGLSIEQRSRVEGEQVVVELDSWHVGNALEAADDAGLLNARTQDSPESDA